MEVYGRMYFHSYNPCTRKFESKSEITRYSGCMQCARRANSLELSRMFQMIPSELCFKDSLVALEELHAARERLQQHHKADIPLFEDTAAGDENQVNKSKKGNSSCQRNGCMQSIESLGINTSTLGRPSLEKVLLFQKSKLELKLSNNKCLALPPLCSRGAGNWMHSIVQVKQTRKRLAQLIGYQNKLSHLVGDRWFKLIKMGIFVEKSFERQWNVLEKHFDPNEMFSEYSKWTARCTLACVQDHMYALLQELIYLFERVSYKNNFSNSEASRADILFKSIELDASLLPYPIRKMTEQEENREVCKLCREAMEAGCSPYRRFISRKWVETGGFFIQ
jgi:hypothetical protein